MGALAPGRLVVGAGHPLVRLAGRTGAPYRLGATRGPVTRRAPNVYPDFAAALRAIWDDPIAFGEAAGYRGLPTGRKRFGPVHRHICARLLRHPRTSTLIPRNHGKTALISVVFPAWEMMRRPWRRIMVGSASLSLGKEIIGEIRDLYWGNLEFETLRPARSWSIPLVSVFPFLRPAGRQFQSGATEAFNIVGREGKNRESSFFTTSPETSSTGKHPNFIIVDDPSDGKNSRTYEQRQKVIRWFGALEPILQSADDPFHHIGTPWAPNDISEVLRTDARFRQLRLSAFVPGPGDGKGPGLPASSRFADKVRGLYPLDESFLTAEELAVLDEQYAARHEEDYFSAQYLCEPMVSADTIFRDEVLIAASAPPSLPAFGEYAELLLWDPVGRLTGTQGDANGLVIVQPVPAAVYQEATGAALGLEPDRNVFIVRFARQVNGGLDDALQVVEHLCAERPSIRAIWIEEAATQNAVAPWLRERGRVEGVQIRGQKVGTTAQSARLQGIATGMRDGQIVLAAEFPGRSTLIRQLSEYPKSDYDDLPCALALLGQHKERRGALPEMPPPPPRTPTTIWPEQVRQKGRTSHPPPKSWP